MPETPVHSTPLDLSHQLGVDEGLRECELKAARRYRQALLASGEFDHYEIDAMVEGYKNRFPHMPRGWVAPWCDDKR